MLDKILFTVMMWIVFIVFASVAMKIAQHNPHIFKLELSKDKRFWSLVKKNSSTGILIAFFVDMGMQLSFALGDLWFKVGYYPTLVRGIGLAIVSFVLFYVVYVFTSAISNYTYNKSSKNTIRGLEIFNLILLVLMILLLVYWILF